MIDISVIVPVFNSEKTLNRCLDSILNQTFKNFEVICVNDGSQDNSGQILNEYKMKDERIKVIEQKNKGLSGARNTGINLAKGKYVTFIDSDDWIEINTFEKIKENIDKKYDVIRIDYTSNDNIEKNKKIYKNELLDFKKIHEQFIPKVLKGEIR